jgi:hypothetical protein
MPIPEPHVPHESVQTWRGFLIHIATVTIGLLIAIALEQCVEAVHHLHQRHQLQHDLREEAARNGTILKMDAELGLQAEWFRGVLTAIKTAPAGDAVPLELPQSPCIPGTIGANGTSGTVQTRYQMPSDTVWTTARDAGLIIRLPVNEARMYARLAHNYALQATARDRFAYACERIDSLHTRFAAPPSDKHREVWTLNRMQANELAAAAAEADTSLSALMWRTRWNLKFEEGIARGATSYDELLMAPVGEAH